MEDVKGFQGARDHSPRLPLKVIETICQNQPFKKNDFQKIKASALERKYGKMATACIKIIAKK